MKFLFATALSILTATTISLAQTSQKKIVHLPPDNAMAHLKPGPGMEKTKTYCGICHSTDYIVRQPHLDAQHWQAEVKKMITVFGAPVSDEDAKLIGDYLGAAYGPEAPMPASAHGATKKK